MMEQFIDLFFNLWHQAEGSVVTLVVELVVVDELECDSDVGHAGVLHRDVAWAATVLCDTTDNRKI